VKKGTIYVAGHRGLVGSAIVRRLTALGRGADLVVRTRAELDLRSAGAVAEFFGRERPTYVFLAAARVGGILANDRYSADFIHENLAIQSNVIDSAYRHGVEKLLFLGSSCIYPKLAPQPIREDALLTGPLEPTNSAYAIAKIAGIEMVNAYRKQHGFRGISAMPTNLYGPGDNFDLQNSHVLPALIARMHAAKIGGQRQVTLWGTGAPRRELLHVDDLADAVVTLMEKHDSPEIVNVGTGEDVSIRELAGLVARVVEFSGDVVWDTTKPDGTPRKLLDVARLHAIGWRHTIGLEAGVRATYAWFREHVARDGRA